MFSHLVFRLLFFFSFVRSACTIDGFGTKAPVDQEQWTFVGLSNMNPKYGILHNIVAVLYIPIGQLTRFFWEKKNGRITPSETTQITTINRFNIQTVLPQDSIPTNNNIKLNQREQIWSSQYWSLQKPSTLWRNFSDSFSSFSVSWIRHFFDLTPTRLILFILGNHKHMPSQSFHVDLCFVFFFSPLAQSHVAVWHACELIQQTWNESAIKFLPEHMKKKRLKNENLDTYRDTHTHKTHTVHKSTKELELHKQMNTKFANVPYVSVRSFVRVCVCVRALWVWCICHTTYQQIFIPNGKHMQGEKKIVYN